MIKIETEREMDSLRDYAVLVRKTMLDMYDRFGCLSGAFSMVELYVALYLGCLNIKQIATTSEYRTRILPKGTSSLAFYATLSIAGLIDPAELEYFGTKRLPIMHHVDMVGIDATQYTLGPSLGTAVGMALASKLKKIPFEVICFMGDGELQEHVDQSAKSAAKFRLGNLTVVVDCNKLQSNYPTTLADPTMIEDIDGRLQRQKTFWESCGWHVVEIDGHNFENILDAFRMIGKNNRPYIILAHTVKGKGIVTIEGALGYQHKMDLGELKKVRRFYDREVRKLSVRFKDVLPLNKHLKFPALAIPRLSRFDESMRVIFSKWIASIKRENPGLIYSLDSDCKDIFSSQCTEKIVSASEYGANHIFPGLNERLTFTIAKGLGYEGIYTIIGCRANNLTDTSEEWNAICLDNLPVLLAGTRPGAIQADWGPTKCSFMDIEILSRHGTHIYQPSNSMDLVWILEKIYKNIHEYLPAYLRIPDFNNIGEGYARDDEKNWKNGYYTFYGQTHIDDFVGIIASGDILQKVTALYNIYRNDRKIKVLNLFNLTHIFSPSLQDDLSGAIKILSIIEARSQSISELIFKES